VSKQAPTVTMPPERLPGEKPRDYERRLQAWIDGEDVRTKTDLSGWKTCDFHLNREPV